MTCVSPQLLTHKLNVPLNINPIQQKKRRFVPDRSLAIKADVEDLMQANILFEVKYLTLLENPIIVKKSGEGGRCALTSTT